MWDDQPVMSFGDPIYQKIRGYETPQLNKLAQEGMLFTRMLTEPGCTPSRFASMTGQLAIRTGTWEIGFPIEYTGFAAENVTLAEVPSQAGYATGFFGKLHLGDTEESYPHNQGYDEAFWALYNQVASLYNNIGEGANAIIGMKEELLAENPYQRDRTFIQDEAYVFYLEGKKGELANEWRNGSQELQDYKDFDIESRKRTPAYTGIANARPETIAISQPPEGLKEALPYDVLEFIKHLDELPYDGGDRSGPGD
jgi:arylsulfatase